MRIITGILKGRQLAGPASGDFSIRPTADRAREALFSILGHYPTGTFLDLFGGTGAVATEAWSRGYSPVYCVEKSPKALALIEKNTRDTAIQIIKRDVYQLQQDAFKDIQLLFADPPYEASATAFQRIAPLARTWMAPGGLMVWECQAKAPLEAPEGWTAQDSRHYGACCFHFFLAS